MTRLPRLATLAALAALLWPAAASAQYPSKIVGFNGPPIDDYTAQEMFRIPEWSGTTSTFILLNTAGQFDNDAAFRASGLQTEGAAALEIFFKWDPNTPDPNSDWVRVTSFDGQSEPNPALHTQGKVRFKITNRSELFAGRVGLCIGVRETGVIVPQMGNAGSVGTIEWVGVNATPNGIVAGPNHIVDTHAVAPDIQVYPFGFDLGDPNDPNAIPSGTAVIAPAPGQTLHTTPAGDDQLRHGYFQGNGGRVPIPTLWLDPSPSAVTVEWNLATGHVFLNGVDQGGSIAGFTGNGVLDVNPPRGTLEHLAFVKDQADMAQLIDVAIDEMQFESPEPDPTVPPRVFSPIIAGNTQVTVTDLMYSVDQVKLYRDPNVLAGMWTISNPSNPDPSDKIFAISPPAVAGEHFWATQRNHQDGTVSAPSVPVTVLAGPPPYSFSLLVDENGGGSCVAAGWEWVGVTGVAGWVPQGSNLIVPNDAVWQTVDIPLTDPALVRASAYGNGVLGPSSSGFYTMDTVWFTLGPGLDPGDPNNLGPFEVLMDGVQYVDPNGVPTTIITSEGGVDQFSFARGQSPQQTLTYGLVTNGSYDGVAAHRTAWSFTSTATSLGELQRIGSACGTQPLIPSTASAIRFHMVARGKPTAPGVALPTITGPVIGAQTAVRVSFDPNAPVPTSAQVYVNGTAFGTPQATDPNNPQYLDFTGLTLAMGDSVSAKQVVGGVTSDFAYPRAASVPTPPAVQSGLFPTATVVTVNNITNVVYARASQVNVIVRNANGTIAQNVPKVLDPNGVTSTTVTVAALQTYQTVTATQTVNTVTSAESASVTVAVAPPTIYAAPSSATTVIRLQDCDLAATDALIYVYADPNTAAANGTPLAQFHGTFDPTNHTVANVNVSGLVAGNAITARQVAVSTESANSMWEPVTGTAVTYFAAPGFGPPAPDTMEAYTGQTSGSIPFENPTYPTIVPADHGWWGTGRNPPLRWTGDADFGTLYPGKAKNSTPGGLYSAYSPATCSPQVDPNDSNCGANTDGWRCNFDTTYPDPNWPQLMTVDQTEPVIFSVDIYDVGGAGVDNLRQYASVAGYTGTTLTTLTSVGMPGSYYFSGINNNYYSGRMVNSGGIGYFDLNWPGAPQRSVGWHTITVVLKKTRADFYVDGVLAKKNVTHAQPFYNNLYMGGGVPGWEAWYDNFYVWKGPVGFVARVPNFPIVGGPLLAGATTVALSRIELGVTQVTVYANDLAHPIGSLNVSGQSAVAVPVTALHARDVIRATATHPTNGTSELGRGLEVGSGNGSLLVCIGVRETNDTGALGTTGGTTGQLEWIGATGSYAAIPPATAAPIGNKQLTVQNGWQTLTFDPNVDPILAFPGSGNGVLDPNITRGVLEHIAFTVDPNDPLRSAGPFIVYVDDVINVGADAGGADFLITGFEGFTPPAEVLFRAPSISGSSASNLTTPPDLSASSTEAAHSGTQSEKLSWMFKDTTAGRWLRLTTSGAANVSRPIIMTHMPIRISFRVAPAAPPVCRGDCNCDGMINFADINPFVAALTNPANCCNFANCDVNADGIINFADINPFVAKLSPGGPCQP